jgi:photosystem II stability/assembly factor-like uncharacterized protein
MVTLGAVALAAAIWAPSALAFSWSAPAAVDEAPPFGQGNPHDISCPTASLCVAVGGRDILTTTDPTGGPATWVRTSTSALGDFFPNGISCPSETLCVVTTARGQIVSSTDPTGGPSAWKVSGQLFPRGLEGVSCASASLCVALGAPGTGLIHTSTNPTAGASAWTATRLDLPHLENPGRAVLFRSVSCPSVSFCAIAGSDQATRRSDVFTSSDPTGGASAWKDRALHHIILIGGISCPSRSLCVAAAQPQHFQAYPAPGDLVVSTDPADRTSTWELRHPDGSKGMEDVSCPSKRLCTAVDSVGNVITSGHPARRARAWRVASVHGLDPSENFLGVSCPSRSFCVAFSLFGHAVVSTHPRGGSAAWKARIIGGWNTLTSIDCPSESLCVAVDDAKRVVVSTNPTAGPAAWNPSRLTDLPTSLKGITCPTTTLCVGVDGSGDVVTSTDPTGGRSAWRVAKVDAVPHDDVSCPSVSLCVAVGEDGDLLVSRNPTGGSSAWAASQIHTGNLVGVSCPSISLCVAVTGYGSPGGGSIATSGNPAAGAASWSVTSTPKVDMFQDVSCPSPSLCVALGIAPGRAEAPYVLTSTRPRQAASSWSSYGLSADAVDCPSTSFCAVTAISSLATTDDPTGGAKAWTTHSPEDFVEMQDVSCPSASLCVAVGMGYEPVNSAMIIVGT